MKQRTRKGKSPRKDSLPSAGFEYCWLPECAGLLADPEVWFRIIHLAQNGPHVAPVAAYREQIVEIALGPKGAFENGNIGALTLRVPTS